MRKKSILFACIALIAIAAFIQASSDSHILAISELEPNRSHRQL